MDPADLAYGALGLAALAAALLPRLLGRVPISMPMVFLGAGVVIFAVFGDLPSPDPLAHGTFTVHLTEVCVIIALMGAGLAIDRPIGWRRWMTTWRLLAITMPLSIVAVALLGWGILGMSVASAALLAAVLAPTDPVLAGEVQVGEPASDPEHEPEDEARFALTSEAGLNDGLAFPFTYAAIAIAAAGAAPAAWLAEWLAVDVGLRIAVGLVVGLVLGWVLGKLFFAASSDTFRLSEHAEGFVAIAATFLAHGLAELAGGYGFLAVFVCAGTIRASERHHGYHQVLHQYVAQIERLLTVVILVLLGGAIARGLLGGLGWQELAFVAAFLLLVRPAAGLAGLAGGRTGPGDRAVISFFGVRGIGSLFYLAFALGQADFADAQRLWAVTGLVVAGSVLLHGATATPVMALLDRRRRATARVERGDERQAPTTTI
jgi:NhaP-type Na+/H+ or K+/H+ antiporter